jgi:hypothetical protein
MDRPLTTREKKAVQDYCRVCGDLKLCDPGSKSWLEKRGLKPEDLRPHANGTPRARHGRVCIDCRRTAARQYAREHGLSLTRNKSIHWIRKDGSRDPQASGKSVNAGKPLFHQLPKEVQDAARRMLDERIAHYKDRRGKLPDVHAKYLLVANVIRSIKSPNGSLFRNFLCEKFRLRVSRRRYLFGRRNAVAQKPVPAGERVYTPTLEGI